MKPTETPSRKKGPIPGPPTKPYTVMLEPDPAEWAKSQPGGISSMLRKFLRAEYEKAQKSSGTR